MRLPLRLELLVVWKDATSLEPHVEGTIGTCLGQFHKSGMPPLQLQNLRKILDKSLDIATRRSLKQAVANCRNKDVWRGKCEVLVR